MAKTSINTNVKDFQSVQRSLEAIRKELDDLKDRLDIKSSGNENETAGSTGSFRIIKEDSENKVLEIKTEEGWNKLYVGGSSISLNELKNKSKSKNKKGIDQLESEDSLTDGDKAKKTIFDEEANKFVMPRADYISDWTAVGTTALTHNLNTTSFSSIVVLANSSASDTGSALSPGVTVTFNSTTTFEMSNLPGSGFYKVKAWK